MNRRDRAREKYLQRDASRSRWCIVCEGPEGGFAELPSAPSRFFGNVLITTFKHPEKIVQMGGKPVYVKHRWKVYGNDLSRHYKGLIDICTDVVICGGKGRLSAYAKIMGKRVYVSD